MSRFREAKTAEEEANLVRKVVPKSAQYKNKWEYGIFEEWQRQRLVKVPIVEVPGLFKTYNSYRVESLDTPLVEDLTGHRSNALFKYEKVSEMKSTEISDILAPKCSSTGNVSSSKEVSETAVEVGSSASTCEFMPCPYFNNCTISINVNGLSKN